MIAYEACLKAFGEGPPASTRHLYHIGFMAIRDHGWRIVKFTDGLIDTKTADGTIAEEWTQ